MPFDRIGQETDASLIYRYLLKNLVPKKQVINYDKVGDETGVEKGLNCSMIAKALCEILGHCDTRRLPPLASIVVGKDTITKDGRHGMPGRGYFTTLADSNNYSGIPIDPRLREWAHLPREDSEDVSQFQSMVHDHQDLVWKFSGKWFENFTVLPEDVISHPSGTFDYVLNFQWVQFRKIGITLGPDQARVTKYLFDQREEKNLTQISEEKIKRDLGIKSSVRMSLLFRLSPAWNFLIVPGKKKDHLSLNLDRPRIKPNTLIGQQ